MEASASPELARNIFLDVLETPPGADREERLRASCGNHLDLYRTVSKMLADYAALGAFMPGPAFDLGGLETTPRGVSDLTGQHLGPYSLLQKLAEGGCGVVYLAEQERPVRRRVAIKVIKPGMDSASVIARFAAERQALAMMEHPCIAKVFDPGATEEGRPYFVMEFVEGQRVTDYCREHRLSTHQRLELFVKICQGVQHAHQKGVIHRDIKPSNVLITLVDGSPLPKIIDFGIAKAISGRLTDDTIHTAVAQFIGTPAYMSPEQALITSDDIDTRTDIYSLGVLLYELLTGRPPFDNQELLTAGIDKMRHTIREVDPKRPSEVGSAPLDPDLDWIVMKCLEKDRTRRYATANGLAADVQRYLEREPILARPATARYRLGRFVRRNRWQVAAAAAVLLALLGGTAVSTWQVFLAKRAEQNAESAVDFLVDQISKSDLFMAEKPNPLNRLLLERIASELDGKFTGQPLAEAKLRMALGRALRDDVGIHFERAYTLRREELGLQHADTIEALSLLAGTHIIAEFYAEAEALLQEGERVVPTEPGSLARAYLDRARGRLYRWTEKPAEAIPFFERALAAFRKFRSTDENVRQTEIELAHVHFESGQTEEAERLVDEMIVRYGQEAPNSIFTLGAHKAKAFWLTRRGRADLALPILERITPIISETLGTNASGSVDVEWCLGQTYQELGRTNDAVRTYAALTPRWPHVTPWGTFKCAGTAEWFARIGRLDEAAATYKALNECFSKSPPKFDIELFLIARATAAADGWTAAAEFLRNSTNFSNSPLFFLQKGWVYQCAGEQKAYLQLVRQSVRLAPNITNKHDLHIPLEIASLAPVELSREEKQELSKLSSRVRTALPQLQPPHTLYARRGLAQYLFRQGEPEAALQELEAAGLPVIGEDAYSCFLKAACLSALGRRGKALEEFSKGEQAMKIPLETVPRIERFLSPDLLYQEVALRREVQEMLQQQ